MKVQIYGVGGTLGRAVVRAARTAGHTVITGTGSIESVFPERIHGDVVINCTGITKQRKVEDSTFILTNSFGPRRLAEACKVRDARLIQVSTDCVFSSGGPHYESDVPDASDIYAISKLAGEVTVAPHLTVRTSFVGFGARGLLHDLQTCEAVSVSGNLLWTGHTVDTVALQLLMLAQLYQITGLLHIPGTTQSRYALARDLKARWNLPARLDRDDSFVADRRLGSGRWDLLQLPYPPPFEAQLEMMEGPIA